MNILPGVIQQKTEYCLGAGFSSRGVNKEDFLTDLGKMAAPIGKGRYARGYSGVALFLASDLSSSVTGDRIIVGGGAPLSYMVK